VIPPERMNMHTIEAHLRSLAAPALYALLEKNPRYVFFKPRVGPGPATSFGVAAVDGRTIATDRAFFPKGALAFLVSEQPRFAAPDSVEVVGWERLRRFVLDQDTGGSIRGARVDLFWGRGADARRYAGVMKQRGHLYYLLPRAR
jgi:membrane-bound lytic murein transglycosylase A